MKRKALVDPLFDLFILLEQVVRFLEGGRAARAAGDQVQARLLRDADVAGCYGEPFFLVEGLEVDGIGAAGETVQILELEPFTSTSMHLIQPQP